MSTWSSGSKAEKLYCQILEKDGWITKRWAKVTFGSQDVWGIDIIAKQSGHTLWIQVKSCADRFPALLKETKKELLKLWYQCCEHEQVLWAGYNVAKKEWKVIEIKE